MALQFHTDAGHGWLAVPLADVEASGAKISAYSYVYEGTAYLEEDCDAGAFARTFGGYANMIAHYGGIENIDYGNYSPIREHRRYDWKDVR